MSVNFYYEADFEKQLLKFFREKYKLKNSIMWEYLLMRYMLVHRIKRFQDVTLETFSCFIAEEIGLKSDNIFKYKGSDFYVNCVTMQSISNIVYQYPFLRCVFDLTPTQRHYELLNTFVIPTLRFNLKYRKKPEMYRKYLYWSASLNALNNKYGAVPIYVEFPHITPRDTGVRTLEDICEAYIRDMSFDTKNSNVVSEKDIEEYIFVNLEKLLGIKPIQRQREIAKDSIADIYGIDENGPVITELKNAKDDRLLWQLVRYKRYMPRARIIAISTTWDRTLLEEIRKLNYVETYKCSLHVSIGKIDKLILKKV